MFNIQKPQCPEPSSKCPCGCDVMKKLETVDGKAGWCCCTCGSELVPVLDYSARFLPGTKVRATREISNQKGTVLLPGQFAIVRSRFPHEASIPTVIDIALEDGRLLLDIVYPHGCFVEI